MIKLRLPISCCASNAIRAAGMPVFAVPYGYNEGADVRELDVDAIVASLEEAARRLAQG